MRLSAQIELEELLRCEPAVAQLQLCNCAKFVSKTENAGLYLFRIIFTCLQLNSSITG